MPKQIVNTGTSPNSRDGDTLRAAFTKINENFTEVFDNLTVLNGSQDPNQVVDLNIQGSVYALDGTVMLDGALGKLNQAALPVTATQSYKFIANFDAVGDLLSITQLPDGWTHTLSNNVVSINYPMSAIPSTISYWGAQDNGELRIRFPTPGFQAIIKPDVSFQLDLFLNTAVTGASSNQYAIVNILF